MISLIIAGGVYVAATTQTTTQWPDIDNHTLHGDAIVASQVVCRNMWGTPMLPDGKGGFSLIAPINPIFIKESLIIPPQTTTMVAYRPLPPIIESRTAVPPAVKSSGAAQTQSPAPVMPTDTTPAPADVIPTEAPAPSTEAPAPSAETPAPSTGTSEFAPPSGT